MPRDLPAKLPSVGKPALEDSHVTQPRQNPKRKAPASPDAGQGGPIKTFCWIVNQPSGSSFEPLTHVNSFSQWSAPRRRQWRLWRQCLEEAQAEAEAKHAKDIAQSIGLPYLDPEALPSSLAEKMLRLTWSSKHSISEKKPFGSDRWMILLCFLSCYPDLWWFT